MNALENDSLQWGLMGGQSDDPREGDGQTRIGLQDGDKVGSREGGFSRGVRTSGISEARPPGCDAQGQSTGLASGKDKPFRCRERDQPPSPARLGIYDQIAL